MRKNIGTIDRVIRILAAVVIIALYFAGVIDGALAVVLLSLAAVFILTGMISFCPLYYPFGLSTSNKKE